MPLSNLLKGRLPLAKYGPRTFHVSFFFKGVHSWSPHSTTPINNARSRTDYLWRRYWTFDLNLSKPCLLQAFVQDALLFMEIELLAT